MITDVTQGALSAKIFDGLLRFDAKGHIQPCLAQDWSVSQDGISYVFHLRKDIVFHNGRKLTSADVRKSFQRLLDPATGSPRRWVLEPLAGAHEYKGEKISGPLAGIETPDDYTVYLRLTEPFAPFPSLLAMPNAVVIPLEEVQRRGKLFGQNPVGTGPFSLEVWQRDKKMVFRKNAQYSNGVAFVEGIEYRIIPEPWAALTEFTQGKLDWISVPQSHTEEFLSDPAMASRLKHVEGLNVYYVGFNCQKHPLDNPRVRKALVMAVDREKMTQRLMKRRALPAHSPIPPVLGGPFAEFASIPYDPDVAKKILKEEGVENLSLTLYQASSLDTLEVMEVVQDYLAKAGVHVRIVQREWSSFKEAVVRGESDMFFLSWWADYPDPENFLFPNFFSANIGMGGNKSRFADAVFDRLISAARRETDERRRKELYLQCTARVIDQCPWALLWHRTEWVITQPWVQGLELPVIYNGDKFLSVRLGPAR